MDRTAIINKIGIEYHTPNIEGGEYSYVKEVGSKPELERLMGRSVEHFKLDIRFEMGDTVVLVETKQNFDEDDEKQLNEYLLEERVIHYGKKIIAILANTSNDKIKVWKSAVDEKHVLGEESVVDCMEHYAKLFDTSKQNDREKVLKNTYELNELLHKMDISENLRSQFVGTTLLYIKDIISKVGATHINEELVNKLNENWALLSDSQIRDGIKSTLDTLLNGCQNKTKKIELLQKNVLSDQRVRKLKTADWIKILDTILLDIYRYIDADSSEGQDILNLFFIAFNKYTGKADKNQAFTPDHITDFMCRVVDVDRNKVVLDATCGSGSFLVQAMVKELADCRRGKTEAEAIELMKIVKEKHIYGIEVEEKAYGLSTTNMLIHGDGNSNIKFGSCFDNKEFIKEADPDIVLMNPPYNAKPIGIPKAYKKTWTVKERDGKEDPTKGFVFVQYISDVIKELNDEKERRGEARKEVKMAVLLPVSAAIGTSKRIAEAKADMLEKNTLDAVFSLPNEIFYPGASACACCMVFTLGKPHVKADKTVNETFFGYYREDGFKKKKALGRIEQFEADGSSKWKAIEDEWLKMYHNKTVKDGLSAKAEVLANDEWLCEAYMKTDYSKLTSDDFQKTINDYLAHLMKEGKIHES